MVGWFPLHDFTWQYQTFLYRTPSSCDRKRSCILQVSFIDASHHRCPPGGDVLPRPLMLLMFLSILPRPCIIYNELVITAKSYLRIVTEVRFDVIWQQDLQCIFNSLCFAHLPRSVDVSSWFIEGFLPTFYWHNDGPTSFQYISIREKFIQGSGIQYHFCILSDLTCRLTQLGFQSCVLVFFAPVWCPAPCWLFWLLYDEIWIFWLPYQTDENKISQANNLNYRFKNIYNKNDRNTNNNTKNKHNIYIYTFIIYNIYIIYFSLLIRFILIRLWIWYNSIFFIINIYILLDYL